MRTRTLLVSVTILAGMAGAVAAGCGDDTTTPTTTPEGGGGGGDAKADTTTTTEGGGGMDAKAEAAREAAAACVDAGFNIATFDSGSKQWACIQAYCSDGGTGDIHSCGAECQCNSAVARALACVNDGGDQTGCFTNELGAAGGMATNNFVPCLIASQTPCGTGDAQAADTGPGEGGDGGGEAAADGGTDTGSGDTGTGG